MSLDTVEPCTAVQPLILAPTAGMPTPGALSALLGVATFGSVVPQGVAAPTVAVAMPVLAGAAHACEAWHTTESVRYGSVGLVHYAVTPSVLWGAVVIEDTHSDLAEPSHAPASYDPQHPSLLQRAAFAAYAAIFEALDQLGYAHLLRLWNFLPRINETTLGLERYRQFNIGRQDAFRQAARPFLDDAPAACALGSHGGGLVVYFVAGHQAPLAIENPRQVSAYRYPDQYGPRSPTFSRAALSQLPGQQWLFISGTASIVGHQSVHVGDVAAQTHETLNNITTLLAQAQAAQPGLAWGFEHLHARVYVRHPQDWPAVQAVMQARGAHWASCAAVQADVCRHDLLVEIEANGAQPWPASAGG